MIQEREKREKGEIKALTSQINKAIKDNKMVMPITKDSLMKICKAINLHCTETMAFEGLIYCRGKQADNGPPEDFDFDRMVAFLNMKAKFVAPANNPRVAL